jgi:hypothetical protein
VRDAYYHLRLRGCDRNRLLFRITGRFFRPLALNCGLSSAPFLFTKFLRPVIQELRRQGHRIIVYLDDIPGAPRTDDIAQPATMPDAQWAIVDWRSVIDAIGYLLVPYSHTQDWHVLFEYSYSSTYKHTALGLSASAEDPRQPKKKH